LEEIDRILGGGVLPGSTVLVGGEPGIGKSTLMLEVAGRLAERAGGPVLYVSGEEAPVQIKLRAKRLGLTAQKDVWVLGEQRLRAVCEAAHDVRALIVDSIQTIFPGPAREGGLGTTQQVGEVAYRLSQLAKAEGIPVFLIGHITKSGEFAGPKAIEHLVDVALYLEGGRESDVRILRAVKNRYGSTEEIGVFQMGEAGLREIQNPSQFFTERTGTAKPGSVIVPSLEGTRPILVEIQALVADSRGTMPQRRATGLDYNRVALLLAVIEKRMGLYITRDDVYVNVAGGLSLREPAVDLGIAAAVVSSYKNRAIDPATVVVGELGLSGELRRVRKLKERLHEAAKLGYRQAVVPAVGEPPQVAGLELHPAEEIEEAMAALGLD
jgi:DNA repair protein RadA/Sms